MLFHGGHWLPSGNENLWENGVDIGHRTSDIGQPAANWENWYRATRGHWTQLTPRTRNVQSNILLILTGDHKYLTDYQIVLQYRLSRIFFVKAKVCLSLDKTDLVAKQFN